MTQNAFSPIEVPVPNLFDIPQSSGALSGGTQAAMPPNSRIILNANLRQIEVNGTHRDDNMVISNLNSSTIRVNIIGLEAKDFSIDDVDALLVLGRNGNDKIDNRTSLSSQIYGMGDNDQLFGGSGSDLLVGGDGADLIKGRNGNDELRGLAGNDELHGGNGDDRLSGANGNDTLLGNSGVDRLFGDAGNDLIYGGVGDDQIWGWIGRDTIHGQSGADVIYGQDDNDAILGGSGNDFINGGMHHDTIDGGRGNDRLYGDAGNDVIRSDFGTNAIHGGDDHDVLYGSPNADDIIGGNGNDQIYAGAGNDVIRGWVGNDRIFGQDGNDLIFGGPNHDHINGGRGDDRLYGDHGHDFIFGDIGLDRLFGGTGDDELLGGRGNQRDILNGQAGTDRIIYFASDAYTFEARDLRVQLKNKDSLWTDKEIFAINDGLRLLHSGTNNNRLVVDAITGDDLLLEKVKSLGPGVVGQNILRYQTRNGVSTYDRVIQFADWDENNEPRHSQQKLFFVHEVSHNWDNDVELRAQAGVSPSDWQRFKSFSQWTDSNPNSSAFKRSGDGNWWYRATSQFGRSYGNFNPNEDWATVWEYYFDADAPDVPATSNLGLKLNQLTRFFSKLK